METIIQKIRKLLALANDKGATEGEAAAAMRLAHKMLTEHNLTMGQVESSHDTQGVVEEFIEDSNSASWIRLIWDSTAHLYFCYYLESDGKIKNPRSTFGFSRGKKRYMVGKPDNVTVALQMAKYFVQTVDLITRRECKGRGIKYRNQFIQGCSYRLCRRMLARREEATQKEAPATGTGLIVLYERNDALINDFLKTKNIKTVYSGLNTKHLDTKGFNEGWVAGATIGLEQQIESASSIQQRLPMA